MRKILRKDLVKIDYIDLLQLAYKKALAESSIFVEDKTSMIKKLVLPDIEDQSEKEVYKQELIAFFKSHSNFENKIDWNKFKTLTKKDFDEVLSSADKTKGAERRKEKAEIVSDIKNIFKSQKGREFYIAGENDRWLFVAPLNYEAAVFCDSSENQGAGAKWCIGYEKTPEYWRGYIKDGSVFIMAFNKNYKNLSEKDIQRKLKFMIQKDEYGEYHVWTQADNDKGDNLSVFGHEAQNANKMFAEAKIKLKEVLKKEGEIANEKVKEILKNVKKIDSDTLSDFRDLLTKIEIPNNVKRIGDSAFYDCSNLTSVTIPDSVTSIEQSAFESCSRLKFVKIPDSVTSIGRMAFSGCKGLTSIIIPDSVTRLEGWVFSWCPKLKTVTLSNSLTRIEEFMFASCPRLESITIPSSVTSIGKQAFKGCIGLTSVIIPNGVTRIEDDAFILCQNLASVTLPDSLQKMEGDTFWGCENIKTVYCSEKIWNKFRDKFPEDAERKDPQ